MSGISKRFATILATAALAAVVAGACATPATTETEGAAAPAVSLEGLELVEKTRQGEIYADPGVDWSTYDRILLDPVTVSFRKHWQRDQNRGQAFKVQASDMERIKSGLAELFDQVFTRELSGKGGYEITGQTGERVMRITPRIVDLDAYAPDTRTPGQTYQFSESAGRMTLKLEIYDSMTGDLLATASDRQEDPRLGWVEWRTRVSNRADAERMLQRWATALRQRLDAARNTG